MVKRTLDEVITALQEQRKVDGGRVPIEVDGEVLEMVEMWEPDPVPIEVPFPYYLHDDYQHDELVQWISEKTGVPEDHPVWEKVDRPFYEIGLSCMLNTETGDVTILGVVGVS